MNACPLFDQHADLAQFVAVQIVFRPVAFAHIRHTLAPALSLGPFLLLPDSPYGDWTNGIFCNLIGSCLRMRPELGQGFV